MQAPTHYCFEIIFYGISAVFCRAGALQEMTIERATSWADILPHAKSAFPTSLRGMQGVE